MKKFKYIGDHKLVYHGNTLFKGDVIEMEEFDQTLRRDRFEEIEENEKPKKIKKEVF